MELPANIPTSFYVAVGVLVIANLGTIGSLLLFVFRAGMFVKGTNMGIAEAKAAAVRAHKRIDKLEEV
jgi:hypothetical protein